MASRAVVGIAAMRGDAQHFVRAKGVRLRSSCDCFSTKPASRWAKRTAGNQNRYSAAAV